MQQEHKRNLPHIYKTGVSYFITFRLHNSIPVSILETLKNNYKSDFKKINKASTNSTIFREEKYNLQKKYFSKFDNKLHENTKIQYLKIPEIAKIVANAMQFYHGKEYYLISYCIMPNHVHFAFHYFDKATMTISDILQSIKGFSAREANKILNRKGQFWQHESYDHIVRNNKELENIVNYIKMNPVKAHLVKDWKNWKYTFWQDY